LVVTRCVLGREFELEMAVAQADWLATRVGLTLTETEGVTTVRFAHRGWPETNEHFHISSYCWATYLRLLKRYVERGEVVAYEERDEA
jgi:hypothetical protein